MTSPGTRDSDLPTAAHTTDIPRWVPRGLMCLLLVAVASQGIRAISDPDTFWHLRLGTAILDARSVSAITAPWSALSDQPWVPTQWLSEVLLATAERMGGLPAVAWLYTVGLLLLTLLTHRLARGQANALPAAFTTGLTIAAMAASLSPRPHVVTYVCLCLTLIAWQRTIEDLRPRWWLIPLTWVWAMSHGMWFIGPVVGLVTVLGLALDRRTDVSISWKLATIPVLGLLAAGLTPVGPDLLAAPVAVAGVGAFITEWQPPSFRSPSPAAAGIMVMIVVVSWARSNRRVPWTQVLLLALAIGWIVLAARTVAIGALIASPYVASTLQGLLGRTYVAPSPRESWSLRGAAAAIACLAVLVVPHTAAEPAHVPSAMNAELSELAPDTVVYNAYELGGWLRWRHPTLEPVVDGMTEAYSVGHLQDYGQVQAAARDWSPTFDSWSPGAALVLARSPIATALIERRGWVEVAQDGDYVLLVPEG